MRSPRSARAIFFDLDDTLYPYRAFVSSGFHAVSRHLAIERGVPARYVSHTLRRLLAHGERGRELQTLCHEFALPAAVLPTLIAIIREHVPVLRLPRESSRVLAALRGSWRIGVLTNGTPQIQRRKIAALGLGALVDDIVCATECGDGAGKPSVAAFQTALDRLRVSADRAVFVGDDPVADIAGAAAAGIRPIHVTRHLRTDPRCAGRCGGTHVDRLARVPDVAARLISGGVERHAF